MKLQKFDDIASSSIETFLNGAIFRYFLVHRKAMAILILLLWNVYSFTVYCYLRVKRPDLVESATFLFLISLPMGTCLYFTCGFHVVNNVELLYTVENNLQDVQIANPFELMWNNNNSGSEEDWEEHHIGTNDDDDKEQEEEAKSEWAPLLTNDGKRESTYEDVAPRTPKQYSLNEV
jgi:hypothetical protein